MGLVYADAVDADPLPCSGAPRLIAFMASPRYSSSQLSRPEREATLVSVREANGSQVHATRGVSGLVYSSLNNDLSHFLS